MNKAGTMKEAGNKAIAEKTDEDYLENRFSIGLKNHEGHATFIGKPTQKMIDAVNKLADIAYKKLKSI